MGNCNSPNEDKRFAKIDQLRKDYPEFHMQKIDDDFVYERKDEEELNEHYKKFTSLKEELQKTNHDLYSALFENPDKFTTEFNYIGLKTDDEKKFYYFFNKRYFTSLHLTQSTIVFPKFCYQKFPYFRDDDSYLEKIIINGSKVLFDPKSTFYVFLKRLKHLNLSFNGLYSLPDSFSELENLEILELRRNNLSSLPETFEDLENLKEVDLSENNFKKCPKELFIKTIIDPDDPDKNPKSLIEKLNLNSNQIEFFEAPGLNEDKNLKFLLLANNKITKITTDFKKFKKLIFINLDDNLIDTENIAQENFPKKAKVSMNGFFDNEEKNDTIKTQKKKKNGKKEKGKSKESKEEAKNEGGNLDNNASMTKVNLDGTFRPEITDSGLKDENKNNVTQITNKSEEEKKEQLSMLRKGVGKYFNKNKTEIETNRNLAHELRKKYKLTGGENMEDREDILLIELELNANTEIFIRKAVEGQKIPDKELYVEKCRYAFIIDQIEALIENGRESELTQISDKNLKMLYKKAYSTYLKKKAYELTAAFDPTGMEKIEMIYFKEYVFQRMRRREEAENIEKTLKEKEKKEKGEGDDDKEKEERLNQDLDKDRDNMRKKMATMTDKQRKDYFNKIKQERRERNPTVKREDISNLQFIKKINQAISSDKILCYLQYLRNIDPEISDLVVRIWEIEDKGSFILILTEIKLFIEDMMTLYEINPEKGLYKIEKSEEKDIVRTIFFNENTLKILSRLGLEHKVRVKVKGIMQDVFSFKIDKEIKKKYMFAEEFLKEFIELVKNSRLEPIDIEGN